MKHSNKGAYPVIMNENGFIAIMRMHVSNLFFEYDWDWDHTTVWVPRDLINIMKDEIQSVTPHCEMRPKFTILAIEDKLGV